MKLHTALQHVKSEEDVKDAYIKALGLTEYSKNLIDIQTKEIWFEAKDSGKHSTYAMFTQLLHYVQQALNNGEYIPPFLAVIDTQKAAIMKTADVIPFLAKKTIKWGKSASNYTQEALDAVSAHIGTHFVSFKIETHEEEFIETIKNAIKNKDIIRTQITPDNLKQVFDKWVKMVGREINGVSEQDYALLFFADIMHDGTVSTHQNLPAELLHKNDMPCFQLRDKIYELKSKEGYRQFWAIYHKPPKAEYRNYLLERRDSLIPLDERSFKGAYYTPLHVVDRAYDTLAQTLGKDWQKEYLVWDMCCGVGNLEVKHSNPRNIFMSTLDEADVNVMKATKTCVAAERFQYDYLNDDITADGTIDYSLTNKVPERLRKAIADGRKILVLINPPYGETGSGIGKGDLNKKEVEQTNINALMRSKELGYASKELFVQFLVRIAQEIPNATLAMFSTLKYVNAPNFEKFRQMWNAHHLGGFIVHSKAFDGLKGDFPIGFLVWKTEQNAKIKKPITQITLTVLDKKAVPIGEKNFYNIPNSQFLNIWVDKPKTNSELALPLSNAVKVSDNPRIKKNCDGAIGFLYASNNDLQHAGQETLIASSIYTGGNGGGLYITSDNLDKAAIVFSMRQLVTHTWVNHNDQFLQPSGILSEEFKIDCIVWMIFHGKNLTASANDLEWNGRKWSIVNHFIPFTESEVNSPERFESDFMAQYLADKQLSNEAEAVLNEGRKLWCTYFEQDINSSLREKYKLNRADVGWYQIRKTLQEINEQGFAREISFKAFEVAYQALTDKLLPQVYDLGFLKK
ncbi:hypothetical protein BN938_2552 [Mucinivorans hirudinis]|uniref:Uncharacterized protein n=1 Tax=Mucinivorans hirudinis TaxID=1433126 RepID=A0A060RAJ6_9BACT|nr:hypothetical protein BN938_2552 [Mucinivorans hirudinis]